MRTGLMQSLIPHYLRNDNAQGTINEMYAHIYHGDINAAFSLLQTFFSTVPYCRDINHEGHWQQMLYVVFSLFGARCQTEVHTSHGRIDLTMLIRGTRYIVEVKLDGSAQAALDQINEKRYAGRYALDNTPIIKIGVNFSTAEHTITDWKIG
ncbi:MAG: PD-(D/E)XK nuclease domain-containing protein [Bacteroidaceae bacterium]|nr:PD-(D/E)XK nuclease domain-containing protein [Bacteroidaceae bacterium]